VHDEASTQESLVGNRSGAGVQNNAFDTKVQVERPELDEGPMIVAEIEAHREAAVITITAIIITITTITITIRS